MWLGQRLTGLVGCLFRQERLTRLAFFEIEDQHAKLHVCGIKCDEFRFVTEWGLKSVMPLSRVISSFHVIANFVISSLENL